MRSTWRWLAMILLLSLTTGCGMSQEKQEAETVAGKFHTALQAGKFNDAITLCSPDFFKQTSKKDVLEMLQGVNRRLGTLKSAKLVGWNFSKQAMAGGQSGTFYQLTYDVTYAKSPGTEALVIYKPLGGKTFSVLGWHINSPGLLKG